MLEILFVKVASLYPDYDNARFASEVERHVGPEEATKFLQILQIPAALRAVEDIWILSLFKTIFGLSYTGLELNTDYLDTFIFPPSLHALIPQLFQVLPAFNVPVTAHRRLSICCSVVQSGGYVLMPRILAEESKLLASIVRLFSW